MIKKVAIRLFFLAVVFYAVGVCASLKGPRYSEDTTWILRNANEVETFLLDGYDYDSSLAVHRTDFAQRT